MTTVDRWHASPARQASATADSGTGEVRVPLALFQFDQLKGTAELVLTRLEAVELYTALACMLGGTGRAGAGRLA
ncbi:hypothetical protein ACPCTO_08305 [Streptomyces olivoreticuli]